ncbi:protein kinase domain-containing protein [Streptomyces sp. YJ-C3]
METGEFLDGRFRIEEALDRGGMGSIWTATETATGRLVAVKALRLDAYTQGRFSPAERTRRRVELMKRFEREGAILEELDHPAIPRLLHRGYHHEEPYLVMEYVDGVNLRELLDLRRPFPFGAAVAIAVQIAEALGHAHTNGVVHRDLKPGNVVIAAADGAVKLLDFGIAHLADPDATRYTALGATPGSAGYMAPEQLRGQQDISAAVDLYALGSVLFELFTGEKPFEDKPDRNKDTQHLEDLPPRVRGINIGIPEDLDELVWDLLGKTPADRPAGIGEALAVLRAHLPAPGDPGPDPELHPDPTARYRLRGGPIAEYADRVRARSSLRGRSRRASWLGRGEFADRIALARAELDSTGPAAECAQLASALARAVSAWGPREPAVVDAQLVCADAARLDGDTGRARRLYGEVAVALGDGADPRLASLVLEARIGLAECKVPEGDLRGALGDWHEAATETLRLASPPARLVARCREVALELGERGFGAEISSLDGRLAAL